MPKSKIRKRYKRQPGSRPQGTRAVREQNEQASTRAGQVRFTNKWSFLWWTLPALVFGFGSQYAMRLIDFNFGGGSELIIILLVTLSLVPLTAVPTFLIVLGTARSALTMRPIRETLGRFRWSNRWLDRMMASMIFPVILACVTALTFQDSVGVINWSWMILLASAFFPINAALKFAYTEQYTEVTLSPRELELFQKERAESKALPLRARLKRAFSLQRLREASRSNMLAPTLQTLMVWMAPSLVISIGTLVAANGGGVSEETYGSVNSLLAPFSFLTLQLAVFVWSKWHMYGGIGRITRVSDGRPLEPIF